jgi:hypothetical protein
MTKTVTGQVKQLTDRSVKDYYNIAVRTNDDWFVGDGRTNATVGDHVKLEVEDGNQIKKLDIIEEDNQDAQRRGKQKSGNESGSSNSRNPKPSSTTNNMSPRQAGITANSAVKMAAEHTDKNYGDDPKEYIDEVNEMSKAFNNMIKDRLGENLK